MINGSERKEKKENMFIFEKLFKSNKLALTMDFNIKFVVLLLSVVMFSGCVSDIGEEPYTNTPINRTSTTPTTELSLLRISDVKGALLSGDDVPSNYTINSIQTGLVDNAVQYSAGDVETGKVLEEEGWLGNEAVQFDYKEESTTTKSIWVSISVYNNTTNYLPCSVQWKKEELNGSFIEGIGKLAYLTTDIDAELGFTTYQIGSYYANSYINVTIRGAGRSVSRNEAIKYAKKISDRLLDICPECQQPIDVCDRKKTQDGIFTQWNTTSKFLGSLEAPVTLTLYTDFQCPYCSRWYRETFPAIRKNFISPGLVKFEVKNFPLSFHKDANRAALAAECAIEQGNLVDYQDKLYSNQEELSKEDLIKYASELSLDEFQFNDCLESAKYQNKIIADIHSGNSNGIKGTPGFLINGIVFDVGASPYSVFETELNKQISRSNKSVSITFLNDTSCVTCYDVTANSLILAGYGIHPTSTKFLDISDAEGKELIIKYKITKVPTFILSSEAALYPSFIQIWPSVGSEEVDGTFVFRAPSVMGTYKDISMEQIRTEN